MYEESFKNIMGEYQVATKKLEKTLEKTRQEMVKVIKGVTTGRKSKVNNLAMQMKGGLMSVSSKDTMKISLED